MFGFGNNGVSNRYPVRPADAPGPNRGMLNWLSRTVGNWLGPRLSRDSDQERAVTSEKALSGPADVVFPFFLPYHDADYTGETQEMRLAYRMMLAYPSIKASILTKIYGVGSQDLRIRPASKKNYRDGMIADYVRWNLTERIRDGFPGLVWNVESGKLVDGYSVNELIWQLEDQGDWARNIVLGATKPKDVGNDLILQTDEFRNVVGVLGLRYNGGREFAPASFLIARHMPWYDSPTGQSDLRASYSSYWMLDTVFKLRSMGAVNRAFPILVGEYAVQSQQASLETILKNARAQSWFLIPPGARVSALEWAGASEEYFRSFTEDLEKRIVTSIEYAYLQAIEGSISDGRGNSQVAAKRSDLAKWWLSVQFASLLNDRGHGLIKQMVDLNYVAGKYPLASIGSIDVNELQADLAIDAGLWRMGLLLSKDELYEKYSRTPPSEAGDTLPPPQPGQLGKVDPNRSSNGKPEADLFWEHVSV